MIAPVLRRTGYALIERELRRTFRRIVWVGPFRAPEPGMPVVVYANHHLFHDGYALTWLLERRLGRRSLVWMEEYDRFPFFGALGALPFPPADGGRRVRTVRATARAFADPSAALIYFPEGRLHPADSGVLPFSRNQLARLDRVLPGPKQWWPLALHVTGLHQHRPTLRISSGIPGPVPDEDPVATLDNLLDMARLDVSAGCTLLEGRRGPHERWNFGRRRAALA